MNNLQKSVKHLEHPETVSGFSNQEQPVTDSVTVSEVITNFRIPNTPQPSRSFEDPQAVLEAHVTDKSPSIEDLMSKSTEVTQLDASRGNLKTVKEGIIAAAMAGKQK